MPGRDIASEPGHAEAEAKGRRRALAAMIGGIPDECPPCIPMRLLWATSLLGARSAVSAPTNFAPSRYTMTS